MDRPGERRDLQTSRGARAPTIGNEDANDLVMQERLLDSARIPRVSENRLKGAHGQAERR
jgi:hypothetical protein